MSAYVIIYLNEVTDPVALEEYRRLAIPIFEAADASICARGKPSEVLEGEPVQHVVVMKFPTTAAAKLWYESADYQAALKWRRAGAVSQTLLIEGV